MIDLLVDPFMEFAFMRRALVGCLALSLGAAADRRVPDAAPYEPDGRCDVARDPAGRRDRLPDRRPVARRDEAGGLVVGIAVAVLSGVVARSTVLREDASLAAFYLVSLAAAC